MSHAIFNSWGRLIHAEYIYWSLTQEGNHGETVSTRNAHTVEYWGDRIGGVFRIRKHLEFANLQLY